MSYSTWTASSLSSGSIQKHSVTKHNSSERAHLCSECNAGVFRTERNHCLYTVSKKHEENAHLRTSIRTLLVIMHTAASCWTLANNFDKRNSGKGRRTRGCYTASHLWMINNSLIGASEFGHTRKCVSTFKVRRVESRRAKGAYLLETQDDDRKI